MKNILMLIPSYKRGICIDMMLSSIFSQHADGFHIVVCVADNQSTPATQGILYKWKGIFDATDGLEMRYDCHTENIGKAAALNELLKKCDGEYDCIVTADNDCVFNKPWYWLLSEFLNSPFDFVGFASPSFWWHIPEKEKCERERVCNFDVYRPKGIAGALMAFKPDFLRDHPWSNLGGVYGADDALMCQTTQNRAVFYWGEDWLEVDPLSRKPNTPPDLAEYDRRKLDLIGRGINIFKKGWDE